MPNIKKRVYDQILLGLRNDLSRVQSDVIRNKRNFKILVEEQTILKRKRGILTNLIRDVESKGSQHEQGAN